MEPETLAYQEDAPTELTSQGCIPSFKMLENNASVFIKSIHLQGMCPLSQTGTGTRPEANGPDSAVLSSRQLHTLWGTGQVSPAPH